MIDKLNNDEDMKIVGEPNKKQIDEAENVAEIFLKQKTNGNIDKAHTLGYVLAQEIIISDKKKLFSGEYERESDYVKQKRILLAFVVNQTIAMLIPNMLVVQTVAGEFYNTLKAQYQRFYDDISESGAFSFYMLAWRRGENVDETIGKTFAMLCGSDGNEIFEELGQQLFLEFLNTVQTKINEFTFV